MKKSNKKNTDCISSAMKRIPKKVKDRLKPLVQNVLTKCSNVNVITKKLEIEEMKDIYNTLQEIQDVEKDYVVDILNRKSHLDKFYSWCSQYGAEYSTIKIEEISDQNYGSVAEKDIEENEQFLTVPRKLMITENSAKKSKLGPLIAKDPILQHMPSVQISLHLLMELLDANSFWKPYISILPSSYNTILYFTIDELLSLQGSPVLDEVFKLYRSVARQYCYFFQLFQNDSYAKSLNIGNYFTYDLYRWAVSTVMTRQNHIPSFDGKSQVLALVPLFDMCNHANGKLSTDFCLERDALVSYAFQPFSVGDEVLMFYGSRTNADFFTHNGFVYPDNENDAVEIKLGISKSDPFFSMKSNLCTKLNLALTGSFKLHCDCPVNDELLSFLKVNVMKADELEKSLQCEVETTAEYLKESIDLKKRALLFLKDRMYLLLKSYQTAEVEDLTSPDLSMNRHLIHQLRISEKKILDQTYKYCVENT